MPVITIYHPNGKIERHPVGYSGGKCHEATKPYEKYDIPGTMETKPTDEAYREPVVKQVEVEEEKIRQE
jgi:hypothetical protein